MGPVKMTQTVYTLYINSGASGADGAYLSGYGLTGAQCSYQSSTPGIGAGG